MYFDLFYICSVLRCTILRNVSTIIIYEYETTMECDRFTAVIISSFHLMFGTGNVMSRFFPESTDISVTIPVIKTKRAPVDKLLKRIRITVVPGNR